jgi:hypothetical protein
LEIPLHPLVVSLLVVPVTYGLYLPEQFLDLLLQVSLPPDVDSTDERGFLLSERLYLLLQQVYAVPLVSVS